MLYSCFVEKSIRQSFRRSGRMAVAAPGRVGWCRAQPGHLPVSAGPRLGTQAAPPWTLLRGCLRPLARWAVAGLPVGLARAAGALGATLPRRGGRQIAGLDHGWHQPRLDPQRSGAHLHQRNSHRRADRGLKARPGPADGSTRPHVPAGGIASPVLDQAVRAEKPTHLVRREPGRPPGPHGPPSCEHGGSRGRPGPGLR
jgi:hypothetical protein